MSDPDFKSPNCQRKKTQFLKTTSQTTSDTVVGGQQTGFLVFIHTIFATKAASHLPYGNTLPVVQLN